VSNYVYHVIKGRGSPSTLHGSTTLSPSTMLKSVFSSSGDRYSNDGGTMEIKDG